VCVLVRTVKGKWLELSTPNLVDMQYMAVTWHALTVWSKGQRSGLHGYQMHCWHYYACQYFVHCVLWTIFLCRHVLIPDLQTSS